MSDIKIRQSGIIELETDAIVNAANENLTSGGGVCGAIFRAAGDKLKEACAEIGGCATGDAVVTPGFDLSVKYIIHAVGPVWRGGDHDEARYLYSAYEKSLEIAKEKDCHSIGFPLISTGIFGYPKKLAWRKAIQACNDFMRKNPDYEIEIIFAIIDTGTMQIGWQTLMEH